MCKQTIEQLEAQVKQLAAENAELKHGAEYFTYCNEMGFERYSKKDQAIKDAERRIDACREEAYDGWSEDVGTICWGLIVQQAVECDHEEPAEDNGWLGSVDYKLASIIETPATDAILASLRAEGVEMLREHPAIQLCSLTHVCDEVAAQLRSQSEQVKGVKS